METFKLRTPTVTQDTRSMKAARVPYVGEALELDGQTLMVTDVVWSTNALLLPEHQDDLEALVVAR